MPGSRGKREKSSGDKRKVRRPGVEDTPSPASVVGGSGKGGGGQQAKGSASAFKPWQLERIKECASVGCTLEETADNADTTRDDILDDAEAMAAFRRGANKARFELGMAIMEMAKQGQPQMVTQALKLFERQASEMPAEELPPLDDELPE